MTTPTPQALREALARHERREIPALPGRTNDILAGVLVPLVWTPDPEVVVTMRPPRMRLHGGEICFPGGRPEPDDADLFATALREAREELGVREVEPLGELSRMPVGTSDHRLVPFVVALPDASLEPDPAEVAAVLRIRLRDVLARETVEAIPFAWRGRAMLSPYFHLGGHVMYGATANTFWELVTAVAPAFGVTPPRLVEGPLGWEDVHRWP